MKTVFLNILASLALLPIVRLALAQAPGPSPTNSYGCKPHNDHWDCEGPITPTLVAVATSASAGAPPPTVMAVTTSSSPVAATSSAPAEHDHEEGDHEEGEHKNDDHSVGTGSLAPSPTNSIGCVAHGDHWDCKGPRPASVSLTSVAATRVIANATITSASPTPTFLTVSESNGAVKVAGYGIVGGLLGVVGALAL